MTKDEITNEYFEWMYQKVNSQYPRAKTRYRKLLCSLHGIPYRYVIKMDENRMVDGKNLRYRFGYDCGYSNEQISEFLNDDETSVLEMMIALALRCEETIMDDSEKGDRLPVWFWGMINSLGLTDMTNPCFNRHYTESTIERFLNQDYEPDGTGGLFQLRNRFVDMRNVEIWYQMCWYLDEVIKAPHM